MLLFVANSALALCLFIKNMPQSRRVANAQPIYSQFSAYYLIHLSAFWFIHFITHFGIVCAASSRRFRCIQ